ncbi:alpha/beta hydrolase [Streptomyces sp. A7024]|uniref:Alpha/beta hydrolase n=1 Tax=Streptomyces coryli TaxID=1128680 RepID=A0A6G4TWJ0_9ACTN|nr:alpha/beta hydrolase [Streptomyces coryli]NGN63371.1 alpha/beta hydrolase [Streptomyces coryli]
MISNRISRTGAAALVALAVLGPAVAACDDGSSSRKAAASAEQEAGLSLPRPAGPQAIGEDTLHLVDKSRRDLWAPGGGARELMVSVFYPAAGGKGRSGDRAPYMSAKESALLLKAQKLDEKFGAERLASVRTNAVAGARPDKGKHPLVVLSPGFTLHRATQTGLAEELASRGYVVALVDHAYESFGTEFPGKGDSPRMRTCIACEKVEQAPSGGSGENKMLAKAARNRAADLSFVVDELTGRKSDYAPLIDPRRIGAAGHSLGGNAAAVAAGTDHRIRAAANMDGTFFAPLPTAASGRPLLMLGTAKGHNPRAKDVTWPREWQRHDGWKRWLTVADSGHFTFTDFPVLGGQVGMTDPAAPLSGERSGQITRGYAAAFFDHHLRGRPAPLLEGPTKANPEVTFHNPQR